MPVGSSRIIAITFRIAHNPSRLLTMYFYAGTRIWGVKQVFANRVGLTEHSDFVPADPIHINLYHNGELLHDDIQINRPLDRAVLTLRAGDEP